MKPRSARSGSPFLWAGAALCAFLAIAVGTSSPQTQTPAIRAAYFYNYMNVSHLDSLVARGFNQAVIHWITDSLDARGSAELRALVSRGSALGIEVVPEWALQAGARLSTRPAGRRYTWGSGLIETAVACPLDSLYWRSALLDRAEEFLRVAPETDRLAVDLEMYAGRRHHYDAGPCRCGTCLGEYLERAGPSSTLPDPRRLSGLLSFEESRLAGRLTGILAEFAARHPGVELGVLDLDYDSFVHRALARALARTSIPTTDYCERSYSVGGSALPGARARLDSLGLAGAKLVGGLWLKRFSPRELPAAVASVAAQADGYFVFTTFSLWLDPAQLEGPYTLQGTPGEYWRAFEEAHRTP
jgi:hypothetical protein